MGFSRKINYISFSIILSFFTLCSSDILAQERIVLSTGMNTAIETVAEHVIKEAYQKLGIDVQVKKFPAKRALMMSNRGESDGELYRISNIDKNFKNLIMIPIPVYTMEGVIATQQHTQPYIWDIEQLKSHGIVGRVRGILWSEQLTTGLNEVVADDYKTLLKLLELERIDVALGARLTLLDKLRESNIEGITIQEPPLIEIRLYHYLHKKRADLVPEITKALRNMQQNNRINQIKHEVVSALMINGE